MLSHLEECLSVGKFENYVLTPTEIKERIYLLISLWQPAPKGAAPCQVSCNEQLAENQILKLICKTLDELQLCNT